MRLTHDAVRAQRDWTMQRAPEVVALINDVRADLAEAFGTEVSRVDEAQYREAVEVVFARGDLAVNVAALVALLRELDVEGDYPGFVVDEVLARELAGMLAGRQPLRTLGEATFHYADVTVHEGATAGEDDLLAALAAGFQTRLPGWGWTEGESPFAVDP